jgi:hypothetical protein
VKKEEQGKQIIRDPSKHYDEIIQRDREIVLEPWRALTFCKLPSTFVLFICFLLSHLLPSSYLNYTPHGHLSERWPCAGPTMPVDGARREVRAATAQVVERQIEERQPCSRRIGRERATDHASCAIGTARWMHLQAWWRWLGLLLLQREALIGDVGEGSGDDDDRARGIECTHDVPAYHLPLASGEEDGEAGGARGSRRREEGARERQDLEPPLQGHDGARGRRRLPQRDVGDHAAAAQHADAALPPASVRGHAVEHVAAAAHLQDVGAERVGALPRDDHGRLRLVLRARWAPAGAAGYHIPVTTAGSATRAIASWAGGGRPAVVVSVWPAVVGVASAAAIGVVVRGLLLLSVVVLQLEVGVEVVELVVHVARRGGAEVEAGHASLLAHVLM